jgi:hypothetical protein
MSDEPPLTDVRGSDDPPFRTAHVSKRIPLLAATFPHPAFGHLLPEGEGNRHSSRREKESNASPGEGFHSAMNPAKQVEVALRKISSVNSRLQKSRQALHGEGLISLTL